MSPGAQIYLGEHWYTVVGVLAPVELAPELDTAGTDRRAGGGRRLRLSRASDRIFVRAHTERTDEVAGRRIRCTPRRSR